MANEFKYVRLAAALGCAAVGLGFGSTAQAVVVVGGDNGWEVSFDGNINAFYVNGSYDRGWNPFGLNAPDAAGGFHSATQPNSRDVARVTSGFLPAFFSFNVKSPTVDGIYATARFSFAPTIQNGNDKNQLYAATSPGGNGIQGSSIDTREVLVNINGPFGVMSFGRTLSLFGRNAILKDMTLFGVGISNVNGGSVTAGRIGRGYTYPNFNARISYKTPVMAGFQAEVGLYDPSVEENNALSGVGILDQTDTPRFEGELSFTQPFSGGGFQFWVDGLWQSIQSTAALGGSVDVGGWGVGTDVKWMGFDVTGYYYGGQGLGRSLQFNSGTACNLVAVGTRSMGSICDAAEDSGYYLQGTYTFNGVTKVGVSYGESSEDHMGPNLVNPATNLLSTGLPNQDVKLSMWTVGVYHDVNSWLKLIAEYSSARNAFDRPLGQPTGSGTTGSDTFSIGSFFIW